LTAGAERCIHWVVKSREVIRILKSLGCVERRQKGSHRLFQSPCGKCLVPVAHHAGVEIPRGTLGGIERSMAECLGSKWLTRSK
jgi:predicted RNA binding protein YcfA (HicA-like mRNA interferase family)